jgi:uncharacterized membrane protein (DUF485 family)
VPELAISDLRIAAAITLCFIAFVAAIVLAAIYYWRG